MSIEPNPTSISLGDEVIDKVTGFSGIAMYRIEYLTGCNRIGVQPKVREDGTLPEYQTFDEPQLEVVKPKAVPRGPTNVGGPEKYMPKDRN